MKLNDNVALDFIDQDILYCWGCPDYAATLLRLNGLYEITVDPDIKKHIDALSTKLLLHTDQQRYEQLFYQNRLKLEKGVKGKLRFARELMEMEMKEAA